MPLLELGVIMRIGRVPVVVGSLRDPRVVRSALETAVRSADCEPRSTDAGEKQNIELLGELLHQMTGEVPAARCLL